MSIICERCHYTSDNISNMYKHLNRKKPCEPIYSDLSSIDLINKFKKYDKAITNDNGNIVYKCRYCDKSYELRSSRCTHQNNCQVKPYYDKYQELTNEKKELTNKIYGLSNKNKELTNENQELINKIHELTNNQINSPTFENNMIINEFKNNFIEKLKNKMQQHIKEITESVINELNNNIDSNYTNFESIKGTYDIDELLNESLQLFYNKTYNQLNQN